jgi:hypothetical protein
MWRRVKYRAEQAGRPVEAASGEPRAVHHLPSHPQKTWCHRVSPQRVQAPTTPPGALFAPTLREPGNHAERTRCGAYPPPLYDMMTSVQRSMTTGASSSRSIARAPACSRSSRSASSQRTGVLNGAESPAFHSPSPSPVASCTTPALDLERCRTIPSRLVVHSGGAVVPPDPSQLKRS